MTGSQSRSRERLLSDEQLERELRALLSSRHPGPAPLALHERVLDVPAESAGGQRDPARLFRPLLAAAAALLLVAGAVVFLAWRSAGQGPGPGPASTGVTPTPTATFDPNLVGPGIVDSPGLAPVLVLGIALVAVLVVGAIAMRRRVGWLLIAGALLVSLMGLALANVPAPVQGSSYGPGLALRPADMPPGYDGRALFYVTAGPREPYAFAFTVRNDGPLPVRIDGIVDPGLSDTLTPYSTAVWMDAAERAGIAGPGTPFTPVELAQGDERVLWLVQKASPCSIGPTWDPASATELDTTGYTTSDVTLRFSVLGWPRTTELKLPFDVFEPTGNPCPAQP